MKCPACNAADLNRLAGADGYHVARCMGFGGRVVEVRQLGTLMACPACDFVATKADVLTAVAA
jgi:hypothetical protein